MSTDELSDRPPRSARWPQLVAHIAPPEPADPPPLTARQLGILTHLRAGAVVRGVWHDDEPRGWSFTLDTTPRSGPTEAPRALVLTEVTDLHARRLITCFLNSTDGRVCAFRATSAAAAAIAAAEQPLPDDAPAGPRWRPAVAPRAPAAAPAPPDDGPAGPAR